MTRYRWGVAGTLALLLASTVGLVVPAQGRPDAPAQRGATLLKVTTTGLPAATNLKIKLTRNGTTRIVKVPVNKYKLPAGTYKYSVPTVRVGAARYFPDHKTGSVTVKSGKTKTLNLNFGTAVTDAATTISPSHVQSVEPAGSTQVVTFDAVANAPHLNDIVMIGVGPNTPFGLFGKVTSASGAEVVLSKATLFDAVPNGVIDTKVQASAKSLPKGSGWRWNPVRKEITGAIDIPLDCGNGTVLRVQGGLSFTPVFDLEADWQLSQVNRMKFVGTVQQSSELTESLSKAHQNCNASGGLLDAPIGFDPVTVRVGGLPIVLVPAFDLYLTATASADSQLTVGMSQDLVASTGMTYVRGQAIKPVREVNESHSAIGPDVAGTAHAVATINPQFFVAFYGGLGPYVSLDAGWRFDSNKSDNPWWDLESTVHADAGLPVPLLDLAVTQNDLIERTFPVTDAAGPFPAPVDADGDTYFVPVDCDDSNPAINPAANDVIDNGIDENCDGRDAHLNTGDIQVTVTWNGKADMDLYVKDIAGEIIYYGHRSSDSGGIYDFDHTGCNVNAPGQAENTYWPTGAGDVGHYEAWVQIFSTCGSDAPDVRDWHLVVKKKGVVILDETGTGTSAHFGFNY